MTRCEEYEFFSKTFSPHLTLPGFCPGAGGFFHGHPNTTKRILIFGTDFGQLAYQQGLAASGGEPVNNCTIRNLSKILTGAGISLEDCFLTNSVLCAWLKDRLSATTMSGESTLPTSWNALHGIAASSNCTRPKRSCSWELQR